MFNENHFGARASLAFHVFLRWIGCRFLLLLAPSGSWPCSIFFSVMPHRLQLFQRWFGRRFCLSLPLNGCGNCLFLVYCLRHFVDLCYLLTEFRAKTLLETHVPAFSLLYAMAHSFRHFKRLIQSIPDWLTKGLPFLEYALQLVNHL